MRFCRKRTPPRTRRRFPSDASTTAANRCPGAPVFSCPDRVVEAMRCRVCNIECKQVRSNQVRCPSCRRERERHRRSSYNHVQRAKLYGVKYETFNPLDVFERDNWTCGFCGGAVDKSLRYPDPLSASLDHIIPMGDGGGHLVCNVRCSHYGCNCSLKR